MFKKSFKHYKSRHVTPIFPEVLDYRLKPDPCELLLNRDVEDLPLGLQELKNWRCFQVRSRPGLIYIQNPFTTMGQRYWTVRCLKDFPKSPHRTNLSPKTYALEHIQDWWSALMNLTDKDNQLMIKLKGALRWSTLGYQHDWDTKIYTEADKTQFPDDLKSLTEFFAKVLGFQGYSAEAAIINYYPIGSTLSAHTDHSESDLEAPLFSFSFGQTAIFLIGSTDIEEKPTAIYLKSGDVLVMSKESRLCYHAVPRIMREQYKPWNDWTDDERPNKPRAGSPDLKRCRTTSPNDFNIDKQLWINCSEYRFWNFFEFYLQGSRINMNVRQVLKEGQTTL